MNFEQLPFSSSSSSRAYWGQVATVMQQLQQLQSAKWIKLKVNFEIYIADRKATTRI